MVVRFFTLLAVSSALIGAQETENLSISAEMFDSSANFRQDLCERYLEVDSGTIELANALQGIEIRTIFEGSDSNFVLTEDGTIDESYPGLVARLLDEICARAGCTWRNSFSLLNGNLPEDRDFTELLDWMTQTYDLAADSYSSRTSRMRLGIAFPEPWFDSSIILVGKSVKFENAFNFFAWVEPFSWDVWALSALTIFLTGFIYNVMNNLDRNKEKFPASNADATYLTALAFTGKVLFKPSAHGARMFTIGLAFWATIMGSAYTANLARALVSQERAGLIVSSVDDAVRYGLSMCAFQGSNQERTVLQYYPNAKLVPVTSASDLYMGVHNGVCDFALTGKSYWDIAKYQEDSNPGCELQWVGRAFENILSGFATRADTGIKCTSLLRDVFNLHIREMKEDGIFSDVWSEYYRKTSTNQCDPTKAINVDESTSTKMTLKNLGGVFILLYMMIALGFAMACFANYKKNHLVSKDKLPEMAPPKEQSKQTAIADIEQLKFASNMDGDGLESFRQEMTEKLDHIKALLELHETSNRLIGRLSSGALEKERNV